MDVRCTVYPDVHLLCWNAVKDELLPAFLRSITVFHGYLAVERRSMTDAEIERRERTRQAQIAAFLDFISSFIFTTTKVQYQPTFVFSVSLPSNHVCSCSCVKYLSDKHRFNFMWMPGICVNSQDLTLCWGRAQSCWKETEKCSWIWTMEVKPKPQTAMAVCRTVASSRQDM